MSHHVVRVCPLKLFDDVLQLAAMALCAEEALESALALLQNASKIALDSLHMSRPAEYALMTGDITVADIPR